MPSPSKGEKRKDFMKRCMGDSEAVKDFPNTDQRYAFCSSQWDRRNNMDNSKELRSFTFKTNEAVEAKKVNFEGKEYLVFPVVAIREGVLNGEFVPAEEIARFVDSWNGIPLTIHHPQIDGVFVSANSPDVLESVSVGRFFNAKFEDKSLKGELWLDVGKIAQMGGDAQIALDMLLNGDKLEVSTGYFAESIQQEGMFNGEHYEATQYGIAPDHLALLPGGLGACSWEDGCGAPRTNIEDKSNNKGVINIATKLEEILKTFADFIGYSVHKKDKMNMHITDCCRCGGEHDLKMKTLSAPVGDYDVWAMCPVQKQPILRTHDLHNNGKHLGVLLNKLISDRLGKDNSKSNILQKMADFANIGVDKVKQILNGDVDFIPASWIEGFAIALNVDYWDIMFASDLDRETFILENYPALQANEDNQTNNSCDCSQHVVEELAEDNTSNTEKEVVMNEKESIIDSLISNDKTSFTEDDKEQLNALSVEFLQKLIPNEVTVEEDSTPAEEEVQVQEEEEVTEEVQVQEDLNEEEQVTEPVSEEEPVLEANSEEEEVIVENNTLSPEVEEAVEFYRNHKQKMISVIVSNSEFAEEELKGKSAKELEKLVTLCTKKSKQVDNNNYVRPLPKVQGGKDSGVPVPPPVMLAKRVN